MNETGEPSGRTRSEQRAGQRYLWEFSIGILAYLALFLALPRIVQTQPGTALNVIVALVPLAPVIWMIIAIARHVRRIDELQRLLFLRSFTLGFAVSMVTALTIALLSGAGVDVQHAEWIIFLGGMTSWGLSLAVLSIRASR